MSVTLRRGWVVDRFWWRRFRAWAASANWRRKPLEKSCRSLVPTTGGLYMICAFADCSVAGNDQILSGLLYDCLYAGKAENLRRRFGNHLKERSRERACFDALDFWWVEVAAPAERERVEDIILKAISPTANRINASKSIAASLGEPLPAGSLRRGREGSSR